jgi:hypothetical protein
LPSRWVVLRVARFRGATVHIPFNLPLVDHI